MDVLGRISDGMSSIGHGIADYIKGRSPAEKADSRSLFPPPLMKTEEGEKVSVPIQIMNGLVNSVFGVTAAPVMAIGNLSIAAYKKSLLNKQEELNKLAGNLKIDISANRQAAPIMQEKLKEWGESIASLETTISKLDNEIEKFAKLKEMDLIKVKQYDLRESDPRGKDPDVTAQIMELDNEIKRLEQERENQPAQLEDLQAKLSVMKNTYRNIENGIKLMPSEVEKIEGKLAKVEGKLAINAERLESLKGLQSSAAEYKNILVEKREKFENEIGEFNEAAKIIRADMLEISNGIQAQAQEPEIRIDLTSLYKTRINDLKYIQKKLDKAENNLTKVQEKLTRIEGMSVFNPGRAFEKRIIDANNERELVPSSTEQYERLTVDIIATQRELDKALANKEIQIKNDAHIESLKQENEFLNSKLEAFENLLVEYGKDEENNRDRILDLVISGNDTREQLINNMHEIEIFELGNEVFRPESEELI